MNKEINKELKNVLDADPFTTAEKGKVNILETYHECLAQAYAVSGWKDYMESLINVKIRDAILNFKDTEDLRRKQGYIEGLKELLSRSKLAYINYTKIQYAQHKKHNENNQEIKQEQEVKGQEI